MSQSMHELSAEELHTLATKAIDAKATAYCMPLSPPSPIFLLALVSFSGPRTCRFVLCASDTFPLLVSFGDTQLHQLLDSANLSLSNHFLFSSN